MDLPPSSHLLLQRSLNDMGKWLRCVDSTLGATSDFSRRYRLSAKHTISASGWIIIIFSFFFLLTFHYLGYVSYRDPTSYFFDPHRAYQKLYSSHRIQEAESYISASEHAVPPVRSFGKSPLMCAGITTVARRGDQYVRLAIGSLLAGLGEEERNSLFLIVLIGHTEPSKHPVFSERWVDSLPDRVLEYKKDSADYSQVRAWEEEGVYRNKTIYDYTYLMKDCYDTGAHYVAMFEDDILAVEGWFRHALKGLDAVVARMHTRDPAERWVYLRLFYTDDLLGWNSEEWPSYLLWSVSVWILSTGIMFIAKEQIRRRLGHISPSALLTISCFCVSSTIALLFLAGRQTVWPISPGIHEMNKYGCCSQALVFPRSIIPSLLERTDLVTDWLVDMMIEKIADQEGYVRWAVVPALMQHIGAASSKGYGFDNSAKHLWNSRYELHPY